MALPPHSDPRHAGSGVIWAGRCVCPASPGCCGSGFAAVRRDRQPAERARGLSLLWGEVTDAAGGRAVSRLQTPEGYTFTALSALLIAPQGAGWRGQGWFPDAEQRVRGRSGAGGGGGCAE